jgi:hypothetical protein
MESACGNNPEANAVSVKGCGLCGNTTNLRELYSGGFFCIGKCIPHCCACGKKDDIYEKSPDIFYCNRGCIKACYMCGEKGENLADDPEGRYSGIVFCTPGDCFKSFESVRHQDDLTKGIPYGWVLDQKSSKYPWYHCKVPDRVRNKNGELKHLICGFCGKKSANVISHPLVPADFGYTSFCMNAKCYREYVIFMKNAIRIPYAIQKLGVKLRNC